MPTAALRRSGGSLIVTIPQAYAEQNRLEAGSLVCIEIDRGEWKLKPAGNAPDWRDCSRQPTRPLSRRRPDDNAGGGE